MQLGINGYIRIPQRAVCFCPEKKGVCVHCWASTFGCTIFNANVALVDVFVALFFWSLFSLKERIELGWGERACNCLVAPTALLGISGSTFIYFSVVDSNKRLLCAALFVALILWDKCLRRYKPGIYIGALRNMDALLSQGRVFFFLSFSTDDNKRVSQLWLCVCPPTRPMF